LSREKNGSGCAGFPDYGDWIKPEESRIVSAARTFRIANPVFIAPPMTTSLKNEKVSVMRPDSGACRFLHGRSIAVLIDSRESRVYMARTFA
jgi:hypothetical protein